MARTMVEGITGSGLKYAIRRSSSAVAYCALSVRCGTRDEAAWKDGKRCKGYGSGIAHFVEHTIFKGTTSRSASVINGYLDKLGGELNAYTTKEEIVLHATVLKEDLPKAAALLFELISSATFPEKEIELERGVVLDEINSYKDSPAEEAYDLFEELLFAGHPLSGPILGTAKSVRAISSAELKKFVAEKFVPSAMAFTIVADLPEEKMLALVSKLEAQYFIEAKGSVKGSADATNSVSAVSSSTVAGSTVAPASTISSSTVVPTQHFTKTISRRNHQANVVLGAAAPSLYGGEDRVASVLLANILGGPASNSILNSSLREKRGLVYGVECTYTQYCDTGIMAITLGCDKENVDKCLKLIELELAKLRECPLSPSRLKAAKKQLLGQLAISGDNGENQCLSMGKSLLAYSHVLSDAESIAMVNSITSAQLQRLAQTIFANLSTLILI